MRNKELEIALTTYIALEHNQDECSGFIDGYIQCQEDMAKNVKIIDLFISEINKEFPNENWEYLEFIKDRLINSLNKGD
jgi:hypothetical protein